MPNYKQFFKDLSNKGVRWSTSHTLTNYLSFSPEEETPRVAKDSWLTPIGQCCQTDEINGSADMCLVLHRLFGSRRHKGRTSDACIVNILLITLPTVSEYHSECTCAARYKPKSWSSEGLEHDTASGASRRAPALTITRVMCSARNIEAAARKKMCDDDGWLISPHAYMHMRELITNEQNGVVVVYRKPLEHYLSVLCVEPSATIYWAR
ncbi:unnamed protein product [Caenorhabditis auriculariae]|uniref:Uncharacterized protein n=1 Tax=Caenorhabditis auriculariae TaxID=2777116 RepID=A0A8S1GNN2_9PELO|nr:unnamed protein product [Caenorhabditis auriculariae]